LGIAGSCIARLALHLVRDRVWIGAEGMNKMMFPIRVWVAGIALLAAGSIVPATSGASPDSEAAVTCINSASGASWQIAIDLGKATVDANPAKITEARISWFDPADGGNYTLDRKSGDLTASVASSTGGYFRHGRCSLGKLR
jgi:hypothetical protein